MEWLNNNIIMTFLGVALGALVGLAGTVCASLIKLKEIKRQHNYNLLEMKNQQAFNLEQENIKAKKEIGTQMLHSIYSLQRMNDGLIQPDLAAFKNESYIIMTKAKIYCSHEVCELYDKFLKKFFTTQGIYDGKLVDDELVPAIRKDLGIDK